MGHISIAKCSCGFESGHLLCAGGMENFTTVCDAPVICGDCGRVGTTNLLDNSGELKAEDSARCPSCGSNNVVVAVGLTEPKERVRPVGEWNVGGETVYFLPGPYRCPSCGEKKLTVQSCGCWD